jgi:hypothetical protein
LKIRIEHSNYSNSVFIFIEGVYQVEFFKGVKDVLILRRLGGNTRIFKTFYNLIKFVKYEYKT